MSDPACLSLLEALHRLTDPRQRRGVRHPFASLLALTFLHLALCAFAIRFPRLQTCAVFWPSKSWAESTAQLLLQF